MRGAQLLAAFYLTFGSLPCLGFYTSRERYGTFGGLGQWRGPQAGEELKPFEIQTPGAPPLQMSHGTTTVALVFDGGVIAAVDSRASMGSYIGSSTTKKVIQVSDHIVGTMAGGAADCQFWLRVLSTRLQTHEGRISVKAAARMLANMLHEYREAGFSIGTMVMGWDENGAGDVDTEAGGAGDLYYVDDQGSRVRGKYFAVGSGATYAYGVLDASYRANMTTAEAIELGRSAVKAATVRDAGSGGYINVYHINSTGVHHMKRADTRAVITNASTECIEEEVEEDTLNATVA